MATIQKRKYLNKTSYQVRIRRLGIKTITKSFMNRIDAKRWARNMETKLDRGDYSDYSTAFIGVRASWVSGKAYHSSFFY